MERDVLCYVLMTYDYTYMETLSPERDVTCLDAWIRWITMFCCTIWRHCLPKKRGIECESEKNFPDHSRWSPEAGLCLGSVVLHFFKRKKYCSSLDQKLDFIIGEQKEQIVYFNFTLTFYSRMNVS
uniref:Uncharacterized protein n=1 Tax=Cacopsylla melanoneura TaxID=428564 RepID=A0A8D8YTP9_9HEMI